MLTVNSTINLAGQAVPNIIPAVQGDTGRVIVFTLADFTIPSGSTATYYVQKPSGEAVYNSATIDGNKITVELTAQSLAETGDNYGQVRILNGEDVVTSFDFILLVKPFRGIEAIESTTEMNIFDRAVQNAMANIDGMLPNIIAPVFNTSTAYTAGDYVIYSGKLYQFTTDHAAGAWTGADAEETTVSEDITALKEDLTQSVDDLKSATSDLNDLAFPYCGYFGHLKKYHHEVGFYTSQNEYNSSTSYVWFDIALNCDFEISGAEQNGVANILDENKNLIENYVNWSPISRTYKKEFGAYIRLSVRASELDNVKITSANPIIDQTINAVESTVLENQAINSGNWEYGHFDDNTGEPTGNAKAYIRTSDFIRLDNLKLLETSTESGFTSEFYFWNGDTYLGHHVYRSSNNILPDYPTATKMKIIMNESDYSNITDFADTVSKLTLIGTVETLKNIEDNTERIEKVESVLKLNEVPPRMITLIDDDGGSMFYEAILPLVKEMHIPIVSANCGANTSDDMAWRKGRMNWTKLNECMENGVEVVSHTFKDIGGTAYPILDEHGNQVMSDVDIMYDLTQCRNLLRMHGCNVEAIVSPNKSDEYSGFVKCCEYVGHSYAFTNLSEHSGRIYKRGEADRWYIDRFYLDNKLLDVDALKAVIDNFAPNSTTGWMVANFHCTFSNWADDAKVETMVNNLRTMIQYAISKGIIFVSSEVGAREYLY